MRGLLMIETIAALLAALALAGPQDPVQDPQTAPTRVEDVEVVARANVDLARAFVERVSAPARGRGLGRWLKVCHGIANLDRAVAQPIVDRMAARAGELGIEVEGPGCEANIIVVFTTEAGALTRAVVEADPRVFRHGGNGIDRGTAALREFQQTERPVRWWTLSVPIDSETGRRAVRVPGDRAGSSVSRRLSEALGCETPTDCVGVGAPIIQSAGGASRLTSQIIDQLYKSIVIVDIDGVAGLNAAQLGDYLAMVTLAQVDPGADTGAFDTVLNLFDNRLGVPGMTEWDESYLRALYDSPSRRRTAGAQADAVAAIMNRTAAAEPAE
ncbi:hypothetical protein GGQ87_001695 [Brevundimonas alba]|uniref:DUF2927 domain-containing protein n=1 Tax=Brevundimonas alba TaxID=74314 RepID=A0A7X6BNI5_9CAUL|nr:hypothetical protein [Brevundimonas alba]NJC41437.1 hypothetical protein [Brevundimonas alba]